ncbi:DNA-(apurinic or apyrimidinic site) lyase [Methanococcus aeolicus Nankai-3]|uniref:N-glycosylase/DNA lyase n=1 Tax=Methanococcus aeolicus (strain ATCC BAA-1280 / DSM 17508 / OCM 812 / Nankai-3) TaxID=419665 RepID=A6UVB9_META3|nr:DNA-(apurinic or apyrimidinic site) lyase [Methanococcus aeolicus Nankai-3]
MDKLNNLKTTLKELGIESAKTIEETVDLQYHYLENLQKSLNNDELFLKLVIINALTSYQLSTTGENWWKEFSEYNWDNTIKNKEKDNGDLFENYILFLSNSNGNRRINNVKIKRINKIKPFLNNLPIADLENYYLNMNSFRDNLAKQLNTKKDSKTVVFAIKMFGYASRIVFKRFIPYPFEIEIPKDSRIEKYTKKFTEQNPIEFWNNISKETEIPPLHIDSILWSALGNSKTVKIRLKSLENKEISKKIDNLINIQ